MTPDYAPRIPTKYGAYTSTRIEGWQAQARLWGLSRTQSVNFMTSGWAESAFRESYPLPRSLLEGEACTLPWQGLHRSTVLPGSRRLSSRRAIFLRLILLAWERGRR